MDGGRRLIEIEPAVLVGDAAPSRPASGVARLVGDSVRMLWAADRKTFLAGAGLQLATMIAVAAQLLLAKRLLQLVVEGTAAGWTLWPHLAVLLICTAFLAFAATASGAVNKLLGERAVRHVSARILEVSIAVPLEDFEHSGFYDRLQRAQQQATSAPLAVSSSILAIVAGLAGALGVVVALISVSPLLAPLVLLGQVPLLVAANRHSHDLYGFSYGTTPGDRRRFALARILTARDEAKEVRAFDLGDFIRSRWDRLYDSRIAAAQALVFRALRRAGWASLASASARGGAIALLAWLTLSRRIPLPDAAVAAVALQQLASHLEGLAHGAARLHENALYLQDFGAFVNAVPHSPNTPNSDAPKTFKRLHADAVSYVYPGAVRPAIDGVSLEITAGQVVALVGENGSGKTTLAKVLAALYQPTGGAVTWDGVDISTWNGSSVRDRIGVVFQDFVRFPLTAAENVAAGRPSRADERHAIHAASQRAGCATLFDSLPDGYETMLSRQFDGVDLSGGQWQRVALARAFFRDAPFLVLDEPSAALDPKSEAELFESIRGIAGTTTILLISHRFSTVKSADRIFVLKEGRIVENGSHAQLMALGGLYAELFTVQAAAYVDSGRRATLDSDGRATPAPA